VRQLAAFWGKVTPSIVGSTTDDGAELTRNSSFDFAFGSRYCRFSGKIAPLIVGSPTYDRAQLTRRTGIRTEIYLSYSISLVGRVEYSCLVLVIIVSFAAGDASHAPIGL
jgi:hypothetical protein